MQSVERNRHKNATDKLQAICLRVCLPQILHDSSIFAPRRYHSYGIRKLHNAVQSGHIRVLKTMPRLHLLHQPLGL